jgi:anti-sigma regulatory factor (Ser/Thr protein kinase)
MPTGADDDAKGLPPGVQDVLDTGQFELAGLAATLEGAVDLASERQPDVMLLDAEASGEDAGDLVTRIKRAAPRTRVVVIGRDRDDQVRVLSDLRDLDAFIDKTLSPERVAHEVVRVATEAARAAGLRYPRDPASPGQARHAARQALEAWDGAPEHQDAVELVISELVTNAVVHAASEVDVVLVVGPDRFRVEVSDNDLSPFDRGEGGADDEHGRGLALVEALSGSWGVEQSAGGKTVWVELPY